MFLSDRFIKGTCPKCKSEDQYGDSCEVCGTTYNATELLNPRSTLSGATPVENHQITISSSSQTLLNICKMDPR